MIFLGVDLAWREAKPGKPANPSGLVALDTSGQILDAHLKTGLDEIAAWISSFDQPDILCFIDAPLVVSNSSGMRECEREVGQRYGRWKVSANSTNTASQNRGVSRSAKLSRTTGGDTAMAWTAPQQTAGQSASATRTQQSSGLKNSATKRNAPATSASNQRSQDKRQET